MSAIAVRHFRRNVRSRTVCKLDDSRISGRLKSQMRELTLLDALRLLRLPFPVSEYSEVKESCEKSPLDKSLSIMM